MIEDIINRYGFIVNRLMDASELAKVIQSCYTLNKPEHTEAFNFLVFNFDMRFNRMGDNVVYTQLNRSISAN